MERLKGAAISTSAILLKLRPRRIRFSKAKLGGSCPFGANHFASQQECPLALAWRTATIATTIKITPHVNSIRVPPFHQMIYCQKVTHSEWHGKVPGGDERQFRTVHSRTAAAG